MIRQSRPHRAHQSANGRNEFGRRKSHFQSHRRLRVRIVGVCLFYAKVRQVPRRVTSVNKKNNTSDDGLLMVYKVREKILSFTAELFSISIWFIADMRFKVLSEFCEPLKDFMIIIFVTDSFFLYFLLNGINLMQSQSRASKVEVSRLKHL